jgi:hypothetical protein
MVIVIVMLFFLYMYEVHVHLHLHVHILCKCSCPYLCYCLYSCNSHVCVVTMSMSMSISIHVHRDMFMFMFSWIGQMFLGPGCGPGRRHGLGNGHNSIKITKALGCQTFQYSMRHRMKKTNYAGSSLVPEWGVFRSVTRPRRGMPECRCRHYFSRCRRLAIYVGLYICRGCPSTYYKCIHSLHIIPLWTQSVTVCPVSVLILVCRKLPCGCQCWATSAVWTVQKCFVTRLFANRFFLINGAYLVPPPRKHNLEQLYSKAQF